MKGLQTNFELQNGGFLLTSGSEKAKNAIWFFCIFEKLRVYTADFGGDFLSLVQKPVATLLLHRTIILGNIKRGIQTYVPTVKVNTVDIGYALDSRKDFSMLIGYSVTDENNVTTNEVTFI